jgi:hypothetical protein
VRVAESAAAPASPTLEIHVPISPTVFFFNRIHYLAASLRLNGGSLAAAPIVVTIGADEEPFDPASRYHWSAAYGIEWRWVPRELFRRHSYFATRLYRFLWPHRADVVLMLDADVLVAAPFADLVERAHRDQLLLGVPANATPVRGTFTWEALFESAGLGPVPYAVEHSGFGCLYEDTARRMAPPYFNFGVLPVPARSAARIATSVFDELEIVAPLESVYRGQMSTTLAIVRQQVAWATMPFRYNFVNDECYLRRYREDFDDLRLFHFLNTRTIHKDDTFASREHVERVLGREYEAEVDRRFVELLRPVHQQVVRDP